MLTSTITQEGQITIPATLRAHLRLRPGDIISFHARDNEIVLMKQKDDITASFGIVQVDKKVSLQDIEQAVSQEILDRK